MPSRYPLLFSSLALLVLAGCQAQAGKPHKAASAPVFDLVKRGEYVVRTSGCNDCHTAGYPQRQGDVPTSEWLAGSPLGYNGPWGTSYATNLRLRLQDMTETQWLEYSAHLRTRPIMPDFQVRAISEEDRRAIYHFVKSLGPTGQAAPDYLPPGQTPPAPYFTLVLPPDPGAAPAAAAPAKN